MRALTAHTGPYGAGAPRVGVGLTNDATQRTVPGQLLSATLLRLNVPTTGDCMGDGVRQAADI